jgi:hypothetical protein
MSKRIVIVSIEQSFDSNEAIQPRHDDPLLHLVNAVSNTALLEDHQRVAVRYASSTKEVDKRVSETELSGVGHQVVSLIKDKFLTENTAKKEVAEGNETTQLQKSDRRLEKLIGSFVDKLIQLLDKFMQGAVEEAGKEFGKRAMDALFCLLKWGPLIFLLQNFVKMLIRMFTLGVTW